MRAGGESELGSLLREFWPLLARHRLRLLGALLVMPLSAVMATLVPYLTKVALDDYIVPAAQSGAVAQIYEPLAQLVALAAAVVIVGYLSDACYIALLQRTGQRLIADMREVVFRRTLHLPRSYFDTHPIGTILTRVTSDFEALGESLASGALTLVLDLLKSAAYLGIMFFLNWRLTLVLLILLPLLALLIRFFQSRIRNTFFVARQALSEATGYLQECLNGIKTIQLYSAEVAAVEKFKAKNYRFYRAQNRSNYYDALLFALVEGMTTLSMALILWYSAGELLEGVLTIGVLVAFLEYIQRLIVPLREFTQQVAVLQRSMAALEHIGGLFRVPPDPADVADAAPQPTGVAGREPFHSLEFDDVRFRYRPDGPEILKGISFRLTRGQNLAIVGPTGSGKSTVIRLLTRAYGGYEGSIRLNGEELNTIPAARLSRLISTVHQGVFLYRGDFAFNIALAREGIDAERVARAARYVNAHTFIEQSPQGYRTAVVQGGANLSAGQAQLIAFARAVAGDTELIALDEATSSVDSMTEHLIQQAVGKLYRERTVIAIAHRLSTIRSADVILVVVQGKVVESGRHAELMAAGGTYAQLVGEMESAERESAAESPDGTLLPSL